MTRDINLGAVRETAMRLARYDRNHRAELVRKRRAAGLTQKDVAVLLGVRTKWVRKIESYDSDPRLSELRQYVCVIHAVAPGEAPE